MLKTRVTRERRSEHGFDRQYPIGATDRRTHVILSKQRPAFCNHVSSRPIARWKRNAHRLRTPRRDKGHFQLSITFSGYPSASTWLRLFWNLLASVVLLEQAGLRAYSARIGRETHWIQAEGTYVLLKGGVRMRSCCNCSWLTANTGIFYYINAMLTQYLKSYWVLEYI